MVARKTCLCLMFVLLFSVFNPGVESLAGRESALLAPTLPTVQQAETITGTYGGLTSGTSSNCTDPFNNGPYTTGINIRVDQPTIDSNGVRRFKGLITVAEAGPFGEDLVLDMSAILSAPANDRTLTSGTLTVLWPSNSSGTGTVTGQWLSARNGNPDQLLLNYTVQGSAFLGCSLTGSINIFRLGAPPVTTFSPGLLSQPAGALDPAIPIAQQNGRFQITPRSNVSGLHYNGFVSDQFLNVSNFSVSVEANQTATGGAQSVFALAEDSNNFMRFVKVDGSGPVTSRPDGTLDLGDVSETTTSFLIFQVKVNGVLSSFNIPYDNVLHKYWRFRNEPATNSILFDTSPDQIVWTVQNRVSLQRSVSALTAELSAGTATSVVNAGTTVFQSFMLSSNPPVIGSPLDGAEFLVRAHYFDFLNRLPDAGGLAFWVNQIIGCGTDAQCIDIRRINVSAAYFLSIEFQQTGFGAIRTQRVAFGRKSDTGGLRLPYTQFMEDAQQIGNGVVFGAPGAAELLEQNKQAYATEVATSATFITRFPLSQTAGVYVDALFASATVTPTSAERQSAITAFSGGGTPGRVAALRMVADSRSVTDAEFNAAFVLMQYYGYLRRDPDQSGYQFWLTKLNQFNGNFVNADMVKAFIVSGEYKQRFAP